MTDIIVIVFLALLDNANDWTEIYYFTVAKENFLCKYLVTPITLSELFDS
jgi:hypothetical protein